MGDDGKTYYIGYIGADGWMPVGEAEELTSTSASDKTIGDLLEEYTGSFELVELRLPWWYHSSDIYRWLMGASGAICSCYCRRTKRYTIRRLRHGGKSHRGKAPKWRR